MTKITDLSISRRALLAAGATGAAVLAMPNVLRAQDRTLKVGAYEIGRAHV